MSTDLLERIRMTQAVEDTQDMTPTEQQPPSLLDQMTAELSKLENRSLAIKNVITR